MFELFQAEGYEEMLLHKDSVWVESAQNLGLTCHIAYSGPHIEFLKHFAIDFLCWLWIFDVRFTQVKLLICHQSLCSQSSEWKKSVWIWSLVAMRYATTSCQLHGSRNYHLAPCIVECRVHKSFNFGKYNTLASSGHSQKHNLLIPNQHGR